MLREQIQQSALKNLVYVSPGQYHIDSNISATLYSTGSPFIQDSSVKIAVFSNLPPEKLSHLYLTEISYCFSKNKDDTLVIFPSSRIVTTSVSNHLNTSQFNSLFLHKFMERIGDCLIISLFYEGNQLINPFDNFFGLSNMLKSRNLNKPILIFHQYYYKTDTTDYSKFFLSAIKEFDELYCKWTNSALSTEIKIIENTNEGIYAFDSNKQIIHRLASPSSEIV